MLIYLYNRGKAWLDQLLLTRVQLKRLLKSCCRFKS